MAISNVVAGDSSYTVGPDIPFPESTTIIAGAVSDHGNGGIFRLLRYRRTGAGPIEQSVLYEPAVGDSIRSAVASMDGATIYISLCTGQLCVYEGVEGDQGMVTRFLRSQDRGQSWQQVGSQPGSWRITEIRESDAVAQNSHDFSRSIMASSGVSVAASADRVQPSLAAGFVVSAALDGPGGCAPACQAKIGLANPATHIVSFFSGVPVVNRGLVILSANRTN